MYKQRDGRWIAAISLVDPASGKPRRVKSYHKLRREAVDALAAMLRDRSEGRLVASAKTPLADYLSQWLEIDATRSEPKWHAEHVRYVEKRLVPALGKVPLGKLAPAEVQAFALALGESFGPYSVQKCIGTLRKALNDALDLGLIGNNPCLRVKLPKAERKDLTLWSPSEVKAVLGSLDGDPDRELFVVAIETGARAGELLALTWSDVSFERRTISIQRSIGRVTGLGLLITDTKSDSSRRLIALPVLSHAALHVQEHRLQEWARDQERFHDCGLVFPKRNGAPRTVEGPRQKLQKKARILGLPVLTFHQLRHLHASLAISLGASAKALQARLGHSSIDVTLDTYSHLFGGEDRELADRFDALGD